MNETPTPSTATPLLRGRASRTPPHPPPWLALPLLALMVAGCAGNPDPPDPPDPPKECMPDKPWCHETTPPQTCSTLESPCKHNPSPDPLHCELAQECESELPKPQCLGHQDCNCWRGMVRIECPDPPPVGSCDLGTPTMSEAKAMGMRPVIKLQKHGKIPDSTPVATFGNAYYCQDGMNWSEACREGRTRGPVAPEGHPQRLACEQQYLEGCGPYWKSQCTGSGNQCPITFDPFFTINHVDQNHPENVAAGCGTQFGDDPSWKKQDGHIVVGKMWKFIPAGKGYLYACNSDQTICTKSGWQIDQ